MEGVVGHRGEGVGAPLRRRQGELHHPPVLVEEREPVARSWSERKGRGLLGMDKVWT
jgi:hypothetical protein